MKNYTTLLKIVFLIWFSFFLLFFIHSLYIFKSTNQFIQTTYSEYQTVWPGILPDSKLYFVKVIRNKIVEKLISSPVKKVEFDLLMSDKTIYASKLLVDKGEIALSKETALKGENYYSMLVQDYNTALLENKKIPENLDKKITISAKRHQEILRYAIQKVPSKDRADFEAALHFSEINYAFIQGLRKGDNK